MPASFVIPDSVPGGHLRQKKFYNYEWKMALRHPETQVEGSSNFNWIGL